MIRVFLHIPMCDDLEIKSAMSSFYKEKTILRVYGDYGVGSNSISMEELARRSQTRPGLDVVYPDAIVGHLSFTSVLDLFPLKELDCFTFVQDPIERELLNINYMKRTAAGSKKEWVDKINESNLFEYLRRPVAINSQYRYLGGDIGLSLEDIYQNIKIYRLKDFRRALIELGYTRPDPIEAESNAEPKANSDVPSIPAGQVSIDMLSPEQLRKLRDLNDFDYKVLERARKF